MEPFPYNDILMLSRPKSSHHGTMPAISRGAQFSPFAALKGYDNMLAEAAYRNPEEVILGEAAIAELDEKLQYLQRQQEEHPSGVFYFIHYETQSSRVEIRRQEGRVKRITRELNCITLTDNQKIPISDLLQVELAENA